MRTTKEILQKVREKVLERHLNDRTTFMCNIVDNFYFKDLITHEESNKVIKYMKSNKPKKTSGMYAWYGPGELNKRIKWLDKHINKL